MMLTSWRLSSVWVAALCLIAITARTQTLDPVPLRNWPAPLSWQATTAQETAVARERGTTENRLSPQLQTSGGSSQLGVLVATTPCRLVDTRSSMPQPFGAGSSTPMVWGAGSTTTIPAPSGSCSLPAAMAYSANITIVEPAAGATLQWLTVYPTGTNRPAVSNLNNYGGLFTVANAAVIPAAGGSFNVYVTDAVYVIIDVNGYYISPSSLALGAGTAGMPSLTFSNDTNSGLYSPSAGTVKVTASGNDILTVNSSGIAVNGNVDLTGSITRSGATLLQASGGATGLGLSALSANAGNANTAVGYYALNQNTLGSANVALGDYALKSNTTVNNVSGVQNTAVGSMALEENTIGQNNVAVGTSALGLNTTGIANTAAGSFSLFANTTGGSNTAIGASSLTENTTGSLNTATGWGALFNNTTGSSNTASGNNALYNNSTGSSNIAIGFEAANLVSGVNSNNIHIGNQGSAGDNATIRIGTPGTQTSFFAAGIRGVTTGNNTAIPVVIDSNGQLGTVSSSRTVKRDIEDMGDTTGTLMSLRPVRFRYRVHGPDSPQQYGLVAEEVAGVEPDLVARNKDGEIETVFYDKVNAMLLNEVQKQHWKIEDQNAVIRHLESRLAELERREK